MVTLYPRLGRYKTSVGTLNGLERFRVDVIYLLHTRCTAVHTAVGSNSYGGADVCLPRVPSPLLNAGSTHTLRQDPSLVPRSPLLHMMRFIPPGAERVPGLQSLGRWVVGRTSSDSRLCDVARQFSSLSRPSRPSSRPPRARMVEIENLFSVPAQHFSHYAFGLQPPSPASSAGLRKRRGT